MRTFHFNQEIGHQNQATHPLRFEPCFPNPGLGERESPTDGFLAINLQWVKIIVGVRLFFCHTLGFGHNCLQPRNQIHNI